jgi:hypothetical protein
MMYDYRPDALIQLCPTLLPEDASLAEEVALARSDAAAYYARFQQQLMLAYIQLPAPANSRGAGPPSLASSTR